MSFFNGGDCVVGSTLQIFVLWATECYLFFWCLRSFCRPLTSHVRYSIPFLALHHCVVSVKLFVTALPLQFSSSSASNSLEEWKEVKHEVTRWNMNRQLMWTYISRLLQHSLSDPTSSLQCTSLCFSMQLEQSSYCVIFACSVKKHCGGHDGGQTHANYIPLWVFM